MGMTIAEKIIAAAAGVDSVKPGDIYTVSLDHLMSNDGTTHLTVDMYNNKLKNPHIADTKKLVFIVDHNVPSDSPKTAASQKKMRDFARENNIDFWEGKGVCHQIMIENYVRPGQLIFGADSHTCSYGALGAFGTGVGCTDFLYGMVTGTSWVMVPETVKFNLTGKLPEGVYARDLILTIIGEIGANGCNYQAMEFTGEGARTLSISDRMALCNMAVEAGAKTGIFEADDKALEYLKEHGREPKAVFHSDPDAKYVREYTFDLSKVRPVVARPDFAENWMFFIRKLDNIPEVSLQQLVTGGHAEIPVELLKWLMKGCQVTAVTGMQGCGKTTLLTAMVGEIPEEYTIRVLELAFELHLRERYQNRNIVTFRETAGMMEHGGIGGQEALEVQKKTDGAVSIIGEVVSAKVASWMIESGQTGSLFTIFTHHAKSTRSLLLSLRNSLLKEGSFQSERVALEQVTEVVRFDVHLHMSREGQRYIERISEIVPDTESPEGYRIVELVRFDGERYVKLHTISETTRSEMVKWLTKEEKEAFFNVDI